MTPIIKLRKPRSKNHTPSHLAQLNNAISVARRLEVKLTYAQRKAIEGKRKLKHTPEHFAALAAKAWQDVLPHVQIAIQTASSKE